MSGLGFPIITLAGIVVVSFLIVRIGARALQLTGLSKDSALFQATSAFFGVGFTTHEAELVVTHPVRRRIILHLIVIGNVGVATTFATLASAFMMAEGDDGSPRSLLWLLVIGALAYALARSRLVHRPLDAAIAYSLRRSGVVRAMDYETLLGLGGAYEVAEVVLPPDSHAIGKSLGEVTQRAAGGLILGVTRADGAFFGAPAQDFVFQAGDTLVVYGESDLIRAIPKRGERRSTPPPPSPLEPG